MKRILKIGFLIIGVLALVGLGVGLYFVFRPNESTEGKLQGAVVTSTDECTDAAVKILQKGGSAVDSAITGTLCQGLTSPQAQGLGGGLIAVIYTKKTGKIETLNAREVAPLAASKDMFQNQSSSAGGLSIAVPTELKGLQDLYKKYGKLEWAELVEPVIQLAENGFKVSNYLANVFVDRGSAISESPLLRDLFTNPQTGEFFKEGEVMRNLKLAGALKAIAVEGADSIYGGGSLAQGIVTEIQDAGGIITMEDLNNYEPKWGDAVSTRLFNGDAIYNFPLPASGNIINFIINVLNGYKFEEHSLDYHNDEKLIYHRIVEAFKFAFAKRTKLGDESSLEVNATLDELGSLQYADYIRSLINDDQTFNDFEHYGTNNALKTDYGTGQITILAPNGDAVSLTSTVNFVLGSFVMSESTGMIYNNEMDDFSIPSETSNTALLPAPANFIAPGKSPMSSMSPLIVLNEEKDVKLVIGGAGGILIMTSVLQVIINYLYLNQSIEASLAAKRLHHQLQPMRISYETGYDPNILRFLQEKGHETRERNTALTGFASVLVIGNKNGTIEAAFDPRRGGKSTVFDH